MCSSVCWCTDITWSNTPSSCRSCFYSALICCFPSLWPVMGRHERKEERKDSRAGGKHGVLLMLAGSKADGQSQMDALCWQVSHNSYRSGFWLLSTVNCVAWSALALCFLQPFPSLGSPGWLVTSQPIDCSTASLKMAEKLCARWREKADNGKGALREGETGQSSVSGSLPTQWM